MVKEVEGKTQSLAECWRWLKGLLIDFIQLKKSNERTEELLDKQNTLLSNMDKKTNCNTSMYQSNERNSTGYIQVVD